MTGAPACFAQVIFNEVSADSIFFGGAPLKHDHIFIHGQIRAGRAAVDKARMIALMAKVVSAAAKADSTRAVWVYLAELLPRRPIEFGHLLPERGEEATWTAALPKADRDFLQSIGN